MSEESTQEVKRGPGRPPNAERGRNRVDTRKERIPLGAPVQKLHAEARPGYVRRWVNDEPGRISQAQNGGYSFVADQTKVGTGSEDGNTDMGSAVSRVVDRRTGQRAFLMEIPKDFYDADQAEKQKRIDAIDGAIKTGNINRQADDGRYVPKTGINIKSNVSSDD